MGGTGKGMGKMRLGGTRRRSKVDGGNRRDQVGDIKQKQRG